MYSVQDNWAFWQRLLTMLQNQLGEKTEIILHDLTQDYNHSIVDIRNGYITGRKVGDCGSNLGLEVLRGAVSDGDRYNYIVNTRDGKLLRSSTMFIRDEAGKIVGSLCMNTDITETVRFESYLRKYNKYNMGEITETPGVDAPPPAQAPDDEHRQPEIFANDVSQVLDFLIAEAQRLIGKPVSEMKRADKIEFVRYLDTKGAFLITKSAERVYEYLGISKFTLYNYLELLRNGSDGNGNGNGKARESEERPDK